MHIWIETVWYMLELGIFIISNETEIYADCIPIHQAFVAFWNIYKYHCTVLSMVERLNIEITGRSALWEAADQCSFVLAIIKPDGDSDLAEESVEPITDNIFPAGKDTSVFVFFCYFCSKGTRPWT